MYWRFVLGMVLITSQQLSLSQEFPQTTKECKTDDLKRIRMFSSLLEYQSTKDSFAMDQQGYKGNIVTFSFKTIDTIERNSFISFGSDSIQELRLDGKGIKNLDIGAFSGLSCLNELDLSYNDISNISEGAFQGLSNLKKLDLNNNLLETVPDSGMAFCALKNLIVLDLSNNNIRTLPRISFSSMVNLKLLNLSYNAIRHLDDAVFDGMVSLQLLLLSKNRLSTVKPEMWLEVGNLSLLDLSANYLTSFDTSYNFSFLNLKTLNLSNNYLSTLNVYAMKKSLPNLSVLDIRENRWFCQDLADIRHALDDTRIVLKDVSCIQENASFVPLILHDDEESVITIKPIRLVSDTRSSSAQKNLSISAEHDDVLAATERLENSLIHMKNLMIFFFVVVLVVLVLAAVLRTNYCWRLLFRPREDVEYLDCGDVENVRLVRR